jgi:glucokinase
VSSYLLGFDIGGTKCAVVLGKTSGAAVAIIDRRPFATQAANGVQGVLQRLEAETRQLTVKHKSALTNIKALGISCGGPLDSKRGIILGPPNLPGWEHVPLKTHFETRLGIATYVQNDANACALAEWKWGAGQGTQNMIFLTFGTGLGAGLILDGRLYSGTNDLAGEVGHIRLARTGPVGYGKHGSFEGFCSGGGIANLAQEMIRKAWQQGKPVAFCRSEKDLLEITTQKIAEAAQAGDRFAVEIFATAGRWLGRGLAILVDILNPERIVIGSIFTRQRDLLWPAAQKELKREALALSRQVCEVVPAKLGEAIGDYACLSIAAEEHYK